MCGHAMPDKRAIDSVEQDNISPKFRNLTWIRIINLAIF